MRLYTAIFHYFHKLKHFELALLSMYKSRFMDKPWRSAIPVFSGILLLFLSFSTTRAQLPWNEGFGFDFTGDCSNQGTLANGWAGPNGAWSVSNIGLNGAAANGWFVSSMEGGGIFPGGCSSDCGSTPGLINQTLHISTTGGTADVGAVYSELGFGDLSVTNKRAESPTIDCSGEFVITVSFNYMLTSNANDRCFLEYFDGAVWTQVVQLVNPPFSCLPNETWQNFTTNLPASANGNPDVRIGFRWENNNDGTVAQASVAIDDINITAGPAPLPPNANFQVASGSESTFCEGGCVSFTDLTTFNPDFSTGSAFATYEWSFPGGNPATSNLQNPTVCYDEPGLYAVTLVVTDNIGESAPFTQNNLLNVLDCGPVIAIQASQQVACANEECIDFTDLSTGNGIFFWLWTFTSASGADVVTSFEQNPTNVCLNEIGFYDVTLQAQDADGSETVTFSNYIEIIDCTGPEVFFEASRTVICPGACIDLTDLSTSPTTIFAWDWDLPGGQAVGEAQPGSSTQQNPTVCYELPGNYTITLTATDQEGPSAITYSITIIVDPCTGPPQVGIGASQTDICTGDCVDFFDQSLGLVEEYLWVFQGVSNLNQAVSTLQDPSVICYDTPGTYNVTLTVSNSNGEIDSETYVDFITVTQCINPPVPRIEISADTVCAGKCVQFFNVSTGLGIDSIAWNFQGAVNQVSNEQNPTVCYDVPGTYSVSLFANGAGGDSVRVFNDVITVINTAECRPSISVSAPDTICAGTCANFSGEFIDADSVRWTFPGGNPQISTARNPGLVCFEEVGDYTIIVEAFNAAGASTPTVIDLYVGERPDLNAGADITINAGAVVTLTASVGEDPPTGSFVWQPFEQVDNFRAQTVNATPQETTQFIVFYSEPGTCTATDTVTVFVNFIEAVGVPSAFSPNGDGVNDELRVLGQGIARMSFKVFNRYGQLVFETRNQIQGWDGTHNGKALNAGTFVWTLDVTFAEGATEVYSGDVTLVR
jgi:gliding motility-associated-like protein